MSRKTIVFQIPKKSAEAASPAAPATMSSPKETGVDWWVHQPETPAEIATPDPLALAEGQKTTAPVAITIAAEPDWFEVVKIGFLLPYLALGFWTLGAVQRNLRLFAR